MSTFKGFIAKVNSKAGKSASGRPYTLWSIKLENEDGTEQEKWLSAGFEQPEASEGDYVEVTAEENAKGYLNIKSIKQLKNAPAKVAPAGAKSSGGHVSTTQTSIHYQSARNAAISVLEVLVAKDALPISAAKTKAGEAARYEEIMALVDKLTVRYFMDAETHRILESVADEGSSEPEKVSAQADEETDE